MPEKLSCYPGREEYAALAKDYNLIPVYREIVADLETPVSVYGKIFGKGYSCLLESVEGSAKLSRYSFIAGDPSLIIKAHVDQVEILRGDQTEQKRGNLVDVLREEMARSSTAPIKGLPRFFGGAVGYIGYDCVRLFEQLPLAPLDDLGLPDAVLIFPQCVIVFDHYHSTLKIVVNTLVNGNPGTAYRQAEEKIERLTADIRGNNFSDRLSTGEKQTGSNPLTGGSSLGRAEFCEKVEAIKEYIRSGHILQAVLSQRFERKTNATPFEVYRVLRSLNPSPYMYYLHFDEIKVAGASPEMLVRLEKGIVENRPIAGTRPRGRNEEEDRQLEAELMNDPKERAEHVMLVDLGRNDVGRVSRYGSVEVPVFMACERYSHVMHLVSEVRGKLAEGKDALDALTACFPAGTVSGAPKIRAMEIIDELEPVRRGPYAGAVGYLSFAGDMDTCITIRTIVFARGKAYAQAGAGIVADSRPESEYEETINKARVLLKALQIAEEGLS